MPERAQMTIHHVMQAKLNFTVQNGRKPSMALVSARGLMDLLLFKEFQLEPDPLGDPLCAGVWYDMRFIVAPVRGLELYA